MIPENIDKNSTWLTAFLLFPLLALLGAPAAETAAQRYTAVRASIDGMGKIYLGREIAQVMSYHGAPWLERPERVLAALELTMRDLPMQQVVFCRK